MQKIGVRGTKDQIQAAHAKRVKQLVSSPAYLSALGLTPVLVDRTSQTAVL